jgi:hypothetical protein
VTRRSTFTRTIPARGYQPLYRSGMRCPGCAGANWHVGRISAECARCATALPLAPAEPQPGTIEADIIPFRRVPARAASEPHLDASGERAAEAPAAFPLAAGDPSTLLRAGPYAIPAPDHVRPHADGPRGQSTSEAPAAPPTAAGARFERDR